MTGCAQQPESAPVTGDEANLTQARLPKLSAPSHEALRVAFDAAAKAGEPGFYGHAAAFKWGTNVAVGAELSAGQLTFLANELLHRIDDTADRIPFSVDVVAADAPEPAKVAADTLRLTGSAAADLTAALAKARQDGLRIVNLAPKAAVPGVSPTAGAAMIVDMTKREALVLYGRRGAAPARVECTVTQMHSYEWEEALSKDEYPSVDAAEIPLTGDVMLEIGANSPYSNAEAAGEGDDYKVTLIRTGAKLEFEAKGASGFRAKLVAEGATGTVYGDRDGNGRPNKAATVACKGP